MARGNMTPAHVVEIVTPKKYLLNGLWLGPKRSKRCIVWVHGLGSSMFSKLKIAKQSVDNKTAVLAFNNRGHDKVTYLPHKSHVYRRALRAGAAHERFTDCVDDIQGAVNFARRQGAKEIYVAGHSTGCQKSVFWAHKKGRGVRGLVLLGPVSDYAALRLEYDKKKVARALTYARRALRRGRAKELLPPSVWGWPWIADAQRFMSLYSGRGPEEIFTYWDPKRNPRVLKSVRLPALVLLAGRDEFGDRPAKEIVKWFEVNNRSRDFRAMVIAGARHGFKGYERDVARAIRRFIAR
ncbi:alpha/beta fold hydrolase [Candidatus Kaiserbacteria bacterium]|nr:alpha/beta fold hydrolase [Candidatus Kaiserbacteria bacterium]